MRYTPEPDSERTLVDGDNVHVTYYEWRARDPRAVVHIAHGVGEHARRYATLAGELVDAGYTVVADDHRGHGKTGEEYLGLGFIGPRGIRGAIASLRSVGEELRRQHPDETLVLLGHSWGSLMAQKIIARTSIYDAAVLTGTSLAMPGVLNGGDLNAPWRTEDAHGLEWISRDPQVAERFRDDPLTFDIAEKPAWNTLQALQLLGRPSPRMPRDIPVLVMVGSSDTLGGVIGATLLVDEYRARAGLADVDLEIYDEARHEIFNETNRDEVVSRLIGWLDDRTGAAPGAEAGGDAEAGADDTGSGDDTGSDRGASNARRGN